MRNFLKSKTQKMKKKAVPPHVPISPGVGVSYSRIQGKLATKVKKMA